MIGFLLKGLIRDPARSRFPIMIVTAGAFLTVLLYSWLNGALGDMVGVSARFDTGHLKITTRAYEELSDQMPNDLALLGIASLVKQQRLDENDILWTPRIRFGGLLDVPDAKGETKEQAALRELQEEAGLTVDIHEGFEHVLEYFFKDMDSELAKKKVYFFVGKSKTKQVTLSHEHVDFVWLPLEQALQKLTYDNAKDLLRKVDAFLGRVYKSNF